MSVNQSKSSSSDNQVIAYNFQLFNQEYGASLAYQTITKPGLTDLTTSQLNVPTQDGAGLYHPSMGTIIRGQICKTCNKKSTECIGHHGVITFPSVYEPTIDSNGNKQDSYTQIYVIHEGYREYVQLVLKCFCFKCSKMFLTADQIQNKFGSLKGYNRLRAIADESTKSGGGKCKNEKTTESDGCSFFGKTQSWVIVKPYPGNHFYMKSMNAKSKSLTVILPEQVVSLLSLIEGKDLELIGLNKCNRPENAILKLVNVIPPTARPPTMSSSGEDPRHVDLTNIYAHIIASIGKINTAHKEALRKTPYSRTTEFNNAISELYVNVNSLFDNNKCEKTYNSGTSLRTIKELISGKGRLIRGNTLGKRINYCIRSVAGPNPKLRVNQVGIPKSLAKIVTYPEPVNEENIERMQRYMDEGKVVRIVAGPHSKKRGRQLSCQPYKNCEGILVYPRLTVGDVVHRHLMGPRDEMVNGELVHFKGDYVLVNRQPTLHKMSIMGFEVVIVDALNIQMNVTAAAPFNLDFDGDELNIYVPQTEGSKLDTMTIMSLTQNIVSAQHNKPVVGLTQDAATAAYLLTKEGVWVSKFKFSQILVEANISFDRASDLLERIQTYNSDSLERREILNKLNKNNLNNSSELEYYVTGRELFSILLPKSFSYRKTTNLVNEKGDRKTVECKNGLLYGTVDKSVVGASHNSIVQELYKFYSPERAEEFLTESKWLLDAWFKTAGFSINIGDMIENTERIDTLVNKGLEEAKQDIYGLGGQADSYSEEIKRQSKVSSFISKLQYTVTKEVDKSITDKNTIADMVISGSKGTKANMYSILAPIGELKIKGRPIKPIGNGSTLPCFSKWSLDPKSKGYIANSYLKCLDPIEQFTQQMASREGLLGTATKTAVTGYIQRRVVKAADDLMVYPDGTVRNSNQTVFQYNYGEDGMAGEKLLMVDNKSRFIDIKKLVAHIKGSRKDISRQLEYTDYPDINYNNPFIKTKEYTKEMKSLIKRSDLNQLKTKLFNSTNNNNEELLSQENEELEEQKHLDNDVDIDEDEEGEDEEGEDEEGEDEDVDIEEELSEDEYGDEVSDEDGEGDAYGDGGDNDNYDFE